MTPYEELLALYEQRPDLSLQDDLQEYLRDGYIFATPTSIVIGRRVGDGWFVHVATGVGCLKDFCGKMPYWLPYIGWCRAHRPTRQNVRWYRTEKVMRKVGYI
jgi:hypothetical protein